MARKSLTVISPAFNEAAVIETFYRALKQQLDEFSGKYDCRILIVVDRCSDETMEILRGLAAKDPALQVMYLSARFGHQMSLLAGIDHVNSDVVIMMDCDMQHPPEVLPELLKHYENGSDVVYTVREYTRDIGWFKKATSLLFYKMINWMSDVPIQESAADFRLISGRVAEVLKTRIRERNLFLRGIVSWIGFTQTAVPFVVGERHAGESKYSLKRMVRFGLHGVLTFSKRPLQAAIVVGISFAALGFLQIAFAFYHWMRSDSLPDGWTTLVILLSVFSGVQLVFLGIIGEYIGSILDEVKGRPHYIVDEKINLSDENRSKNR